MRLYAQAAGLTEAEAEAVLREAEAERDRVERLNNDEYLNEKGYGKELTD